MKNTSYRNIIIGVDFDQHPAKLIEKATSLALLNKSTIHLVHTLHFIPETYYDHYAITTAQLDNSIRTLKEQSIKEAEEKLTKIQLAYPSLSIQPQLLEGSSVDAIIDFATKNNADLILLGNYHKPGFIRLLGQRSMGLCNKLPAMYSL